MDQPTVPQIVSPPTNSATPETLISVPAHDSFLPYLFAFFTLLIGVVGGFSLAKVGEGTDTVAKVTGKVQQELKLPMDAVVIQQCATGKGTLYARPKDVPNGPVFMVSKGKVIGVEYMVEKPEFLQGQGMKNLTAMGASVDHVNVGILEAGHAGFPEQHYHVDVYTVNDKTEQSITCPDGSGEEPLMPGMDMTSPEASSEGMPGMQMKPSSSAPISPQK